MHVQTHLLSGWCGGNLFPLTARQRFFCMVSAAVQDVDGLGILISQRLYWDYHHVLAHNLLFNLSLAATLAVFSGSRRWLCFGVYLALGHLHLLLDYLGSGPGWPIHYGWPFCRDDAHAWLFERAWEFHSWQNLGTAAALLLWTVVIAVRLRRTPLELLMPSLDRKLTRASAPAGA